MNYQFSDDLNLTKFFWFHKGLVINMNWASLPPRSQAVWPVLACHANDKGVAWPSERRIAILSGLTDKSARQGVRDLEIYPPFKRIEYYTTLHGKRAKRYHLKLPAANNNDSFQFYIYLLESGMWRMLIPSARALYVAMFAYRYWRADEYLDREGWDADDSTDHGDVFKTRLYDFCEADRVVLYQCAGINRRSFNKAVANLEQNHLVETIEYEKWTIKSIPHNKDGAPSSYKRQSLNAEVIRQYQYERK